MTFSAAISAHAEFSATILKSMNVEGVHTSHPNFSINVDANVAPQAPDVDVIVDRPSASGGVQGGAFCCAAPDDHIDLDTRAPLASANTGSSINASTNVDASVSDVAVKVDRPEVEVMGAAVETIANAPDMTLQAEMSAEGVEVNTHEFFGLLFKKGGERPH